MNLFWLDLETTALDPRAGTILEVAVARATLEKPFEITPLRSWVAHFQAGASLDPFIRDMHTKNGLLKACAMSLTPLSTIYRELLDMVPVGADRETMPTLAGSSVHFDHSFLKVHMPLLAARFSHRHYDVSAIKLFCRSLGMPKLPRAEAHRAADDIKESIDHALACVEWLTLEGP